MVGVTDNKAHTMHSTGSMSQGVAHMTLKVPAAVPAECTVEWPCTAVWDGVCITCMPGG